MVLSIMSRFGIFRLGVAIVGGHEVSEGKGSRAALSSVGNCYWQYRTLISTRPEGLQLLTERPGQ